MQDSSQDDILFLGASNEPIAYVDVGLDGKIDALIIQTDQLKGSIAFQSLDIKQQHLRNEEYTFALEILRESLRL